MMPNVWLDIRKVPTMRQLEREGWVRSEPYPKGFGASTGLLVRTALEKFKRKLKGKNLQQVAAICGISPKKMWAYFRFRKSQLAEFGICLGKRTKEAK